MDQDSTPRRAFAIRDQMAFFVLLTLLISWAVVLPADRG